MVPGYYLKYELGEKKLNLINLASVWVYLWVCNLKEFEKPCYLFSLSPHLTAFLIFSLCHLSGSSVIGTLTTCSGPVGFLSCKRALHCATAKVAHICQPMSLSLPSAHSFPPTLTLCSDLHISVYFVSLINLSTLW